MFYLDFLSSLFLIFFYYPLPTHMYTHTLDIIQIGN